MKLTLHFRRSQNQEPRQFYSLTTTTTAAATTKTSMCNSPSCLQATAEASSQDQINEPSTQTLEPINPIAQPDPDQETRERSNLDQQNNGPDGEEGEDHDEDQENPGISLSAFPPPPSSIDAVEADVRMPSLNPPKRPNKRKKGKVNHKKQLAIEKKLQTLLENLNPIPFIPSKVLDFAKHEKLLKKLGLWDFFHIEFDRNIRSDLIAQLIANYDPRLRSSYVNELRIAVNRADLARAFKLPVKKEKGGNLVSVVGADGVDLDFEPVSEESISFIEGFVSNWVLLHEDTWMMPNEVLNWTKVIKEGHPEKVDWAGLFWFMVEKELLKGEQLVDCYYASHLQYLIKSQREEVMLREPKQEQETVDLDAEEEVVVKEELDKADLDTEEEVIVKKEQDRIEVDAEKAVLSVEKDAVELNTEVKEEENGGNDGGDVTVGGLSEIPHQENGALGGLNVELTLGQDVGEKEEVKPAEMMDVEESKEDEAQQEQEEQQWLLDRHNSGDEHFMQRCNMDDANGFDSLEERREEGDELEGEEEVEEEEEEEEGEDGFNLGPSDDALEGDGLTGNFLQAMESTQIAFGSHGHLHDDSVDLVSDRNDLQHMDTGGPSFYGNNGKREFDHEHDVSHHALNGSNKRLRVDGLWDHKPLDFRTCAEQIQQLMCRATLMYEEKEQAQEHANVNQQILLTELQKRDDMIEHLHKSKCEEIQKRDTEIYRLQRELHLMGNILEDYRTAIKKTNKAFAEYRQKCQLPEEPIYKDAGPGGIVLTIEEIEKQRLKQEEEYKMTCSILEQKAKEAEEGYALQFGDYLNKVVWLDKRLTDVESGVKELRDLYSKPKVSETEQKVVENLACETDQKIAETLECEAEQKVMETMACETDQKVVETSEYQTEQEVVEASECPPSE